MISIEIDKCQSLFFIHNCFGEVIFYQNYLPQDGEDLFFLKQASQSWEKAIFKNDTLSQFGERLFFLKSRFPSLGKVYFFSILAFPAWGRLLFFSLHFPSLGKGFFFSKELSQNVNTIIFL